MPPLIGLRDDRRLFAAAIVILVGIIVSGPPAMLLAAAIAPQPAWRDVETFAASYQPIQQLPYAGGIVLLAGIVWFVARVGALARGGDRTRASAALIATGVATTLIGINYSLQLAYVPAAVRSPGEVLAAVTMVSPTSICWVLEMVGWGVFGAATWLLAPVFAGEGLRVRAIRALLIANGAASILGAVLTMVDLRWVMTPSGLAAYVLWNLLLFVAILLVAIEARPQDLRPSWHWLRGALTRAG